jgi:hypothetical protein
MCSLEKYLNRIALTHALQVPVRLWGEFGECDVSTSNDSGSVIAFGNVGHQSEVGIVRIVEYY